MLWAAQVLKLGIPAIVGFLFGLGAVAVIEPRTAEGKVLLIGTTICLMVAIVAMVRKLFSFTASSQSDRAEGSNEK